MMSINLINLQSLAIKHVCLAVSHVEEADFVHIDGTSAVKMV